MPDIITTDRLSDRLADFDMRRRNVWVVAGFVLVAVVGALVLWSRSRAPVVAPPAVERVPTETQSTGPPAEVLYVHVAGSVRDPGLYELPQGARVADALEAGGGPLPRADLDQVNLAEQVADGTQVFVPRRGESAAPAPPSSDGRAETLVNLNTADLVALETIPGIGPVKGAAILEYRESAGPFESVEDLLEVSGIGPATLEAIRPYVTI